MVDVVVVVKDVVDGDEALNLPIAALKPQGAFIQLCTQLVCALRTQPVMHSISMYFTYSASYALSQYVLYAFSYAPSQYVLYALSQHVLYALSQLCFVRLVYDAKVSIRSKLHLLQTIRSKLSWNGDRLDFVFMGHELRHVTTNPIVNLVDDFSKWDQFPWGEYMWSFFHKRDYNVVADPNRRKYHLDKLASNSKYEANYVLYGFVFPLKVTPSTPVLRSFTRGSSNSKSVHTRVRTEVRHEVHVRIEVRRFVDKEEVHTQAVDQEDFLERAVLAQTVKDQQQMIVDLQRRLLSVEQVTKKLHTGPSDVDHLDCNTPKMGRSGI
ncbi:hypothetical protein Tco_1029321 [Tanacetum coccineum]|uniref:Phospholipase-like protein n=1 Tax=Tanacetum coccineum TaxID=301880 RepID=A0ABQ5G4I4_9ASTR